MKARRKASDQRSLTGAASRLPTGDKEALRKALKAPLEWQTEAWAFFDTVPELNFATTWAGNLCAKVTLFVATMNDEGEPVDVTAEGSGVDPGAAAAMTALLGELAGEFGGQTDIQRELCQNLDVAGECSLVGWAPTATQPTWQWEVRSISELVRANGKVKVIGSPGDKTGREVTEADDVIRCWVRHPRWSDLATAPTQALTTEFRTLQVLTQQMMAESMSRANAGVVLIPNGMAQGPEGATPDGDDEQDDPLMADLVRHVTNPIQDPGDPSSVAPLLWRGDREDLKEVRHLTISRDTGDQLDKRVEARVQRVARGLNVPVSVVMGHEGTTFSNAQQISEDEFTDHLEPRILLQCDLLTVGYLRARIPQQFLETARKCFVWYDATALFDKPDQSEAADEAFDRIAISPAAYRAAKGFTEDQAPTPEEAMRMLVGRKGILTAELSGQMLKYVDPKFQPPAVAPAGGAPGGDVQAAGALLAMAAHESGMTRALLSMLGVELPQARPVIQASYRPGEDPPDPQMPRG